MNNSPRTLLFAGILGTVCSSLLVGTNMLTTPYRLANEKAEQVRNYLAALEVPVPAGAGTAELLEVFEEHVRGVARRGMTVYEYFPSGAKIPVAVAVPFSGAGVWGGIEGVLALEPDMETIRGIRFYRQEETPGLGGDIATEMFQSRFRGRKIRSRSGEPGFKVRTAGTEYDQNKVDAITGATMTSERVERILDDLAKQISKEETAL